MCFICDRIKMINNGTNPYFVKELQTGYVVIGDNQHFKGYTLFLCKEHKTELFQLNHSKKIKFLEEMSIVAEAVSNAFGAEKMNYELLGNGDTHLHWHLFPRKSGDIENYGNNGKGPVWWYPMEKMYNDNNRPSKTELEDMKEKKDSIELSKKKLDNEKEQLATIKQNQIKTARILENTKVVRENYISKLSNTEKDIQSKIDEYNTRFSEINAEILSLAMDGLDTKYIGGELAWPVPGYTRISSKYGMRTHPITGVYKLHTGVDISAPMGANFIAANDGVVTKAGMNSAYGNMVIIDHGGGISTLYAHGSEILVQVGQVVKRGDAVLKVGSTGYSTGPHAHFEVRMDGVVTDPMPYITNGVVPKNDSNEQNTNTEATN